jgi:hypothetical protein
MTKIQEITISRVPHFKPIPTNLIQKELIFLFAINFRRNSNLSFKFYNIMLAIALHW